MKINYSILKKEFSKNGYFVCRKIFTKKYISELINEINKSNDTIKYFDNHNKLRRIERLYNKGKKLNNLNKKFLLILKKI